MQLFLQTSTTNLEKSIAYFNALEFEVSKRDEFTLVFDKHLKIKIDHGLGARSGLTMIKKGWEIELEEIAKHTKVLNKDGVHYFASPSGTWFKLISGEEIELPQTTSKCILGNFAGISLETMDIQKSMDILSCLGFNKSSGAVDQGWVSMTDNAQNSISLMVPFACPHSFQNPSATFFNSGGNPEIIANVRSKNIDIYEEVAVFNPSGEVDNIILREPAGVGFFVFND